MLQENRRETAPQLKLFCVPYAGGSAALFASWQDMLPDGVEVCPIQLPGRGQRIQDDPIPDLLRLAGQLAWEVEKEISDTPYVLFGCSMGAFVAFELARALIARDHAAPERLIVAAQKGPSIRSEPPYWHTLDESELLERLQQLGSMSTSLLQSTVMRELFMPAIRADLSVVETYAYDPEPALPVPITAFCGDSDAMSTIGVMSAWRDATSESFALEMVCGGHFFIQEQQQSFLSRLSEHLSDILTGISRG